MAAACGPIGESAIEDMEQRYVAAQVAEWVFEQGPNALPTPDEIARKTISLIIVETLESETGELLRDGKRPIWATEIAETELREAADALAEPRHPVCRRSLGRGVRRGYRGWNRNPPRNPRRV